MRSALFFLLTACAFVAGAATPGKVSPVRASGQLLDAATPATPKRAPAMSQPVTLPKASAAVPSPVVPGPAVSAPAPATKDVRFQAVTGDIPQAQNPRYQALTGNDPSRVDPHRQALGGTSVRPGAPAKPTPLRISVGAGGRR